MDKIIINDEECRQVMDYERYHISESGRVYRTETGKKRTWRTKGKVYIRESKVHFRIQNGKLRQGQVGLTDVNGKEYYSFLPFEYVSYVNDNNMLQLYLPKPVVDTLVIETKNRRNIELTHKYNAIENVYFLFQVTDPRSELHPHYAALSRSFSIF